VSQLQYHHEPRGNLSGPEQICPEFAEKLRDLEALRIFTAARKAFRAEVARAIDHAVTTEGRAYLADYLDHDDVSYHDSAMQGYCDEIKEGGYSL
jgi:hypothetical protein